MGHLMLGEIWVLWWCGRPCVACVLLRALPILSIRCRCLWLVQIEQNYPSLDRPLRYIGSIEAHARETESHAGCSCAGESNDCQGRTGCEPNESMGR
ncbi:hypothetical protein EV126DRAFT_420111 [Verticillium dahliae]|nr:hypothetical protein EV126DRAFT_420111 [Verticillium dahliae]